MKDTRGCKYVVIAHFDVERNVRARNLRENVVERSRFLSARDAFRRIAGSFRGILLRLDKTR